MRKLEGRVCVITGAGRGLGREHALLFAKEGAKVVVNDLGGTVDGGSRDAAVAQNVVDEIRALGGEAVANTDSVSDWEGARRMVRAAIDAFGDLHVLINNAAIFLPGHPRLFNVDETQWDAMMNVHLRGTFCPTRHAAAYWRDKAKRDGRPVGASVVCTASGMGFHFVEGTSAYGTAKAGTAAFAQIAAKELGRYGIRVNTIAPGGRTRATMMGGVGDAAPRPEDPSVFDVWDPANVSPLVAYLATDTCPYTGGVWLILGGIVGFYEGWRIVGRCDRHGRWRVDELAIALSKIVGDRGAASDKLISDGQSVQQFPKASTV